MSTFEIEIEDLIYDTGYGEQSAALVIEIKPRVCHDSFDAYSSYGTLENYPVRYIEDVTIESASLFIINRDGEESEYNTYKDNEVLNDFPEAMQWVHDWCDENMSRILER